MKKNNRPFTIFLVVGFFCLGLIVGFLIKKYNQPVAEHTCISVLELSHDEEDETVTGVTDYWELLRESDTLTATTFSNNIAPVNAFSIEDTDGREYLVGIDLVDNQVVVNEIWFSDLVVVNAVHTDQSISIGEFSDLSFSGYSPREIVEFLLSSRIVSTYVHLSSRLCLTGETDTAEKYRAEYSASHDYCTNTCVTEEYEFAIEVDKNSGEIRFIPGDPG